MAFIKRKPRPKNPNGAALFRRRKFCRFTAEGVKEVDYKDIDVLKDQGGRDYFKTRVSALEQHHAFAVKEQETLAAIADDAQFRARQKSFDKTLWTLEAAVEQAQEEAGL